MTLAARLPWSQALIVGLGASGEAAARLLMHLGVAVRVYDRNNDARVVAGAEAFVGRPQLPSEALADIDLLVLSPGVPPGPVRALADRYAPSAEIEGELGLGLRMVRSGLIPHQSAVPVALVTGTNGKSTVTALLGELLRAGARRPFVGGNLGTPLCAGLLAVATEQDQPWDTFVLECSSFQLETLPAVPVQVGMVLNVTPDHLDRYDTVEQYANTKAVVFTHLCEGGLALIDDGGMFTSCIEPKGAGIELRHVGREGEAWVVGDGPGHELKVGSETYRRDLLKISGRHNSTNALFALAAAQHLGVSREACERGLRSFVGLPHRMVLVRELDGVRWYNDSKATNVASAMASLGGLAEPFVLIAGGRGKGDDLRPLEELLAKRARGLVTVGEASSQFLALARAGLPAEAASDMADAVRRARSMARPGDAVVLAPACASFDQFRSYAHRGEVFAAAVCALKGA